MSARLLASAPRRGRGIREGHLLRNFTGGQASVLSHPSLYTQFLHLVSSSSPPYEILFTPQTPDQMCPTAQHRVLREPFPIEQSLLNSRGQDGGVVLNQGF